MEGRRTGRAQACLRLVPYNRRFRILLSAWTSLGILRHDPQRRTVRSHVHRRPYARYTTDESIHIYRQKYALSVIDKLMTVFGNDIGLAYDVGCDTWKTVLTSSLRDRALNQRLRLIVPAFHGHQHNRLCQLDWHPMYIEGAGKEDFEGCERAFRDSNMLASGTRLATAFHRHQAIEQHWAFRSLDKYADSGASVLMQFFVSPFDMLDY